MPLSKREQELIDDIAETMRGWDDKRKTKECEHCNGTGMAPSDGRTECGFCE